MFTKTSSRQTMRRIGALIATFGSLCILSFFFVVFPVKGNEEATFLIDGNFEDAAGYGWSHTYERQLHFSNNALPDTVEMQAAGGSRLPFFIGPTGTFTAYPGVMAEMVLVTPTYTVTNGQQMVYEFDMTGALQRQIDAAGNSITFTHQSGRLSRAQQGGRWLDYRYDGQGRLVEVEDNSGRVVQLDYDGVGDLTAVTNPLNLTRSYTYSGSHLLHKVTDATGIILEETLYDEERRAYY